jgi:hypothetical protein
MYRPFLADGYVYDVLWHINVSLIEIKSFCVLTLLQFIDFIQSKRQQPAAIDWIRNAYADICT